MNVFMRDRLSATTVNFPKGHRLTGGIAQGVKKGRINHFMKGVSGRKVRHWKCKYYANAYVEISHKICWHVHIFAHTKVARGRGKDASDDGVVIAPAAALASRGGTLDLPQKTQEFLRQECPVDLGEVTPSSLYNARKMREPDPVVYLVFSSVARLLHFRDLSWDGCRDMLARKDFVHMLLFTHPLDLNTESDGIPGK